MIEIGEKHRVFVLTGAGVSAESGIPTFRGADGLWEGHRIEDVASPQGWARNPELVWQFYSRRREKAATCHPNPAHRALAQLEAAMKERFFLCTQNVDPLHERAGSARLLHMHGELFKSRCERHPRCGEPVFADEKLYLAASEIPRCRCGSRIRPHICWFGEIPFELDTIFAGLERSTIFLCVGSSGVVEPAASFVHAARRHRARTYYVGPEEPANSFAFDECFWGRAGELLPELLGGASALQG